MQGLKFRILHCRSLRPNRHLAVPFVFVSIHCLFIYEVAGTTGLSSEWLSVAHELKLKIQFPRRCVPRTVEYTSQVFINISPAVSEPYRFENDDNAWTDGCMDGHFTSSSQERWLKHAARAGKYYRHAHTLSAISYVDVLMIYTEHGVYSCQQINICNKNNINL